MLCGIRAIGRHQRGVYESKIKRETGFEPVTLRAAIESSTTELPARRNEEQPTHKQTTINYNKHTYSNTEHKTTNALLSLVTRGSGFRKISTLLRCTSTVL
jgi:hypothetical protein